MCNKNPAGMPRCRTLAVSAAVAMTVAGLSAAMPAQAASGWQGVRVISVPPGRLGQQIAYDCPRLYPVPLTGEFAFDQASQNSLVSLTYNGAINLPVVGNGPTTSTGGGSPVPVFGQWNWHFYWPGGAPTGAAVFVNVYCAKR